MTFARVGLLCHSVQSWTSHIHKQTHPFTMSLTTVGHISGLWENKQGLKTPLPGLSSLWKHKHYSHHWQIRQTETSDMKQWLICWKLVTAVTLFEVTKQAFYNKNLYGAESTLQGLSHVNFFLTFQSLKNSLVLNPLETVIYYTNIMAKWPNNNNIIRY